MKQERELDTYLTQQLIDAGWKHRDLVIQPLVRSGDAFARPALVAMIESYPLASFDIRTRGAGVEESHKSVPFPLALVSNGDSTQLHGPTNSLRWVPVPTPRELWGALGREWADDDPRIAASTTLEPPLHIAQAQALAQLLDAIAAGQGRALVRLGVGTGRFRVSIEFAHKMHAAGRARRILIIEESRLVAEQTRDRIRDMAVSDRKDGGFVNALHVEARSSVLKNAGAPSHHVNGDLIIIQDPKPDDVLITQLQAPVIVGFSPTSKHIEGLGMPVADLSIEDLISSEELPIAHGQRAVRLGDLAEIASGHPRLRDAATSQRTITYLTGRSLERDGSWNLARAERRPFGPDDEKAIGRVKPGDILISAVASPRLMRWAIVPPEAPEDIRIASSVMRIRLADPTVRPEDVVSFLTSQAGYAALARLASSIGGNLRLSQASMAQTLVRLPVAASSKSSAPARMPLPVPGPLATNDPITFALESLRGGVLQDLEGAANATSNEAEAVIAKTATRLRQLANQLSPQPLLERVVDSYPFPIARACRQMQDARFNPYEQVLRLRDLFEATAYFVYNVTLADAIHRLPRRFHVADKGARRAYGNFSMAPRITFVAHILKVAGQQADDLFMPELAATSFSAHAGQLRDFRNHISHTSTASEAQQRQLYAQFAPTVEQMLNELAFLSEYRLVRVTSYFVRNRTFVRRMEVYSGVAMRIEESQLESTEQPTLAEHDHLGLLDAENEFLDLFPMYQLLTSSMTHNETHVCYLKHRDGQVLAGESANTSTEVELAGFEQLAQLVAKLEAVE